MNFPFAWEWPNLQAMRLSQKFLSPKEKRNATKREDGLWVRDNRILICRSDTALQSRICLIAHAAAAGHRGQHATMQSVRARFYWPNLSDTVSAFVGRCLQCLKTRSGKCLPLMYGEQIVSEAPGEVLTLDHCHIGESESGAKYILLLKCTFSSICEVIPTVSTDAVPAARAIISWITRWGLPKAIITDGPTSFKNTLLKEITDTLRIKHHICLSYSPWTNGGIERQNREMLKIFRTILSESGTSWSFLRWPELAPLVQYCLNTTPCQTLGNISPLEVMTGRSPDTPSDLLAFTGYTFKTVETNKISIQTITKHVEALRKTIHEIHSKVRRSKAVKKKQNNKGRAPLATAILHVGDYVLLARKTAKKSKLQCNWTGPYVALRPITEFIWELKSLDGSITVEAHVQRIRRYSDASLNVTESLVTAAKSEQEEFELEKFVGWRVDKTRDRVELLCRWKGFSSEWDTYEVIKTHLWLIKNIRSDILDYLHKVTSDTAAMNKAGKYRRKKIEELYSVLASGKPLLSADTTTKTVINSNQTPVKVPKADTSVNLNKQGLTGAKTVHTKKLRVGQHFRHDHDKRIYTIVEVTADEIGARHGQDEYGFKPSYVKSRIINDSSVFKTAKGEWTAKPLGSARRFRTKKAAKAALKKHYKTKK